MPDSNSGYANLLRAPQLNKSTSVQESHPLTLEADALEQPNSFKDGVVYLPALSAGIIKETEVSQKLKSVCHSVEFSSTDS